MKSGRRCRHMSLRLDRVRDNHDDLDLRGQPASSGAIFAERRVSVGEILLRAADAFPAAKPIGECWCRRVPVRAFSQDHLLLIEEDLMLDMASDSRRT